MATLKIGFGRADITPPNGLYMSGYYSERHADGYLDKLTGSCIAVSDGDKTAVVFTLDLLYINQKQADELRNVVAETTGLPYEAVYFCCTHIHTGPFTCGGGLYPYDPEWNSVMYRKLADAANEAIADLAEGTLYTARGEVKDISFIRRYKMKDGRTQTNPGKGNPNIDHPISTPDEMLQLVRIVREGKDDIVLLNFQCHPDVIGGNKYSSDWPGWARRAFEGAVPGTKCLFYNGAQGDTNHCSVDPNSKIAKGYVHSRHMGLCVAGEAMKLYTYAEKMECDGKVDFTQFNLVVPSNRAKPEQLPEAERIIAAHEAGKREEISATGMEYTTVIAEAYRMKRLENGPDSFTLYLNAVRFGNIVFSGIPGEPFTDIGRAIKEQSPFDMTIVTCCANGGEGYYPMKSAFDEGGYEARSSKFASGIAERIIDGSVNMLNGLYNA
nr:hypothetical protein [Clostridia bacterium]